MSLQDAKNCNVVKDPEELIPVCSECYHELDTRQEENFPENKIQLFMCENEDCSKNGVWLPWSYAFKRKHAEEIVAMLERDSDKSYDY